MDFLTSSLASSQVSGFVSAAPLINLVKQQCANGQNFQIISYPTNDEQTGRRQNNLLYKSVSSLPVAREISSRLGVTLLETLLSSISSGGSTLSTPTPPNYTNHLTRDRNLKSAKATP